MNLIENIAEEAERLGMTIYETEKKAGLSRGCIYKWNKHIPSVDKVKRVADELGVPVDKLLE